mmetsp:Transcript_11334/g.24971  ORF Transcript_11334/g.24971 Transcript_11334/m.24971 type:complete len:99 (-) Transcript_11334:369-665(-)
MLNIISKLCWSIRYISLVPLNFINNMFLQNEYSTTILYYTIASLVILLPLIGFTLWCCLAVEEWWMEEDARGFIRRVLHEAEEARLREEEERERKKNG